ncbi:Uncharacterised protein [Yersinia frederiksenii]|nr:Uncharacterised protein [Yersinia frederiksenii]
MASNDLYVRENNIYNIHLMRKFLNFYISGVLKK